MAKRAIASIEYEEVGGIALTIRPPGSWFDSKDFVVFVNGCGVGRRKTLGAAEKLLLAEATRRTSESLDAARRDVLYYTRECNDLVIGGVKRKGKVR